MRQQPIAIPNGGARADSRADWWRDAVIYQIYPRSFADANGDGMGDLNGVSGHLDHLARLGVDALWLSPFYVSPQADAGYDVADYRQVDPRFGTLADFDELVRGAHEAGLRVIVDLVPNHTSDEHPWFRAAVASAPGSAERDRYIFRPGTGEAGELPPNNWQGMFGGIAWKRVADPDGTPGQWYLHLFDEHQPDLNWHNEQVRDEFDDVLRFWLRRGVDGFRVDVAHGLIKADGLPDWDAHPGLLVDGGNIGPMWDQDGVHEIYRRWRRVLGEFGPDRILVAEAWTAPAARLARYVRPDEMNQAFNFIFMTAGWDAARMRSAIDETVAMNAAVGAPTTWVLSNHDVVRHATRFGLSDPTGWPRGICAEDEQPDPELGLARARAATLMMLALPGAAYLYQGEELGLPGHTTLPDAARQDPHFFRTAGRDAGRDGCRVPLPWQAEAPAFGFSPTGAAWLPQPDAYAEVAADRQEGVAGSTLEFYRAAIALRRELGLGRGGLAWSDSGEAVLDFENSGVRVIVNLGAAPIVLPAGRTAVLASDATAVSDGRLRENAAVWLR